MTQHSQGLPLIVARFCSASATDPGQNGKDAHGKHHVVKILYTKN